MLYAITYHYRDRATGLVESNTGLFGGSDPDDACTNLEIQSLELGHDVTVIAAIEPVYNDREN